MMQFLFKRYYSIFEVFSYMITGLIIPTVFGWWALPLAFIVGISIVVINDVAYRKLESNND